MAAQVLFTSFVCPDEGTTTNAIMVGQFRSGSLQLPAAVDGAATIAVHGSVDGTNFTEVLETAPETNPITFAANAAVQIPSAAFRFAWLRLVFSAAQTGGPRTVPAFFKD